jgi:Glycosyl transferase family 2
VPSLLRHRPELSIVVAAFDMARELPRTVYSLSSSHQRGIEGFDYEILVVDNGSPVAVDAPTIEAIGPNVRVMRMEGLGVSPAKAINRAVAATSGRTVGIVLDGARMVTPGVVALARSSLEINQRALVTTMAWHLGPDLQTISQQSGYSASVEDQLLLSIGWPEDGYRLFEIAALAAANRQGWFGSMNESCCTFLTRESFIALGGYDESFVSPGGGYVNLDFFLRATQRPSGEVIVLLGEGSFHQIHGGVATNAADLETWRTFAAEYEALRGCPYVDPEIDLLYLGRLHPAAMRWLIGTPPSAPEHERYEEEHERLVMSTATLEQVVASRDAAVAEVHRLRSSRSWRLTAPVRTFSGLARRLRR